MSRTSDWAWKASPWRARQPISRLRGTSAAPTKTARASTVRVRSGRRTGRRAAPGRDDGVAWRVAFPPGHRPAQVASSQERQRSSTGSTHQAGPLAGDAPPPEQRLSCQTKLDHAAGPRNRPTDRQTDRPTDMHGRSDRPAEPPARSVRPTVLFAKRARRLADFDQMAVGVAHVAADLSAVVLGLGEELSPPRAP